MRVLKILSTVTLLVIFQLQKLLLTSSYWFFYRLWHKTNAHISWVVGVEEVAGLNKYISLSLPNSFSVCLEKHKYYDFSYDYLLKTCMPNKGRNLRRFLVGPVLLGYLLNHADNFLYIWSTGFLISEFDQREFEFRFIKTRRRRINIDNISECKKKIVCFFVGNDIRAPQLSIEFARQRGIEVSANYYSLVDPFKLSDQYDIDKRRLARVTDRYADIIFNAKVDQVSYLRKHTLPFIYFYPDDNFSQNEAKFDDLSEVRVVHAPSSPITKGTQLVRAAIARVKREGYPINYIELHGVDNEIVLKELRNAHIVLNEFYDLVPGVFGVEALASFCALMTAADETVEKDLPQGSNEAWLPTKCYEIYDNLKYLLDNPSKQLLYAKRGYSWALKNASQSESGKRLRKILASLQ